MPTLVGVSIVAFLMVHLAPGDPLTTLTQGLSSQAAIEQLKSFYGLGRSLPEQYLHWLANVLAGDFGVSITSGRRIAPALADAFCNTLKILVPAAVLAVAAGWTLGSLAALGGTRAGRFPEALGIALVSVPPYWLGLVSIAVFGVTLGWLPAMGIGPGGNWAGYFSIDGVRHVLLPMATLAVTPAGILARSTKSALETSSTQDFVEALRARGLPERAVRRRIRRNAMPALFALYALQIAYLLGASILVETVFSWPGIGTFLANAIQQRDMPSIQAGLLVVATAFVALNLAADLLQAAFDPRIRR